MFRDRSALGMFWVSLTALAFEVALSRICSALLQYHIAFAVVSMAVLGVGLGGFVAYGATRNAPRRADTAVRAALVALAPAILLAVAILMRTRFAAHWPWLLFGVLPVFASAGAFQSLLLRGAPERAPRLYAADLIGGAAGALLAVVTLDILRGPVNVALVLAVGAAGVGWVWTSRSPRWSAVALAILGLALVAVVGHSRGNWFDVDWQRAPLKLLSQMLRPTPQARPQVLPELTRWDAASRVDVIELRAPRGTQRLVFIDGETPTPMLQVDPVAPNAAGVPIRAALAALACRLQPPSEVLSIGSGGGYDVVIAQEFGARGVDAVELNRGVLAVVDAARDFTGDVYHRAGVRLHHAEGRLFARRARPTSYDLVMLALAQSLAGNLQEYALSENYLYTREAFADYLRVLRPEGAIAFLVSNPTVQAKLVATALVVLGERGQPAADCVAAISSPGEIPYDHLVLVRPTPFPPAQRTALGAEIAAHGYRVLHLPAGIEVDPKAAQNPVRADRTLVPASDEKPFFFHLEPGTPAGLRLLLGLSVVLLLLAAVVPAVAARRMRARNVLPAAPALRLGAYFVLLGAGFLMVEVLVMQRTIRVVGLPTLNLGLVLATFLVAAGCGSAASARLGDRAALRRVLIGLGLALAILMPILGMMPGWLDPLPLGWRCAVLVLVLFPFAFAMGMPFPSGIRMLPEPARPWVPWFWGLNGVASIAGSALVVAVVLQRGFWVTGLLPAALYVAAAFAAGALSSRPASGAAPVG